MLHVFILGTFYPKQHTNKITNKHEMQILQYDKNGLTRLQY